MGFHIFFFIYDLCVVRKLILSQWKQLEVDNCWENQHLNW